MSDTIANIIKSQAGAGLQQTACLVLNPITVYSYGFLFNCRAVFNCLRLYDGFDVNQSVGACCLSVAGPTMAQLEIFFSSDYL